MKKKNTGMKYIMYCIIFICWACSPAMADCCCLVLIQVLMILVAQNSKQKMLMWSPMSQM